jgi:hypothetical protein
MTEQDNTRIYLVDNIETKDRYLVRAQNKAQAIRHATRTRFAAHVASQHELIELLNEGVKVQVASNGDDEAKTPESAKLRE